MRISIAIMAHPKRAAQVERLEAELAQYPFTQIGCAYDELHDEWHTGCRALRQGIDSGDWHVVIQDDAILTPNFYENVESAIKGLPSKTLFSLYTGTARPLPDRVKVAVKRSKDGDWLRHHQLFWGVGIVIPTAHIEPMLEFVRDIEGLQYDNRIGEFYCRNGLPVYYCIPSLVDHDDDLPTTIEGHGKAISSEPRVAHRLATVPVIWGKQERYI